MRVVGMDETWHSFLHSVLLSITVNFFYIRWPVFKALVVVNAKESEQKSPKGDSLICRPSEEDTLPNRFNVRTSNGRFAISKENDLQCNENLAAKRKSVSVSVKLEFENS